MPSPRSFLVLFLALLVAMPALAKTAGEAPKPLGTFGNWHAFAYTEHDQQVCYMALTKNAVPNKKFKRSEARLMITHRPAEGSKDVISYTPGYLFRPESTVTVRVGTKTFDLFTAKDTAWARDAATDRAISKAVQSSKGMTLTGAPTQRGVAAVTDTLDLKGADIAYRAIGKACGVEVEAEKPAPKKPAGKLAKTKR